MKLYQEVHYYGFYVKIYAFKKKKAFHFIYYLCIVIFISLLSTSTRLERFLDIINTLNLFPFSYQASGFKGTAFLNFYLIFSNCASLRTNSLEFSLIAALSVIIVLCLVLSSLHCSPVSAAMV